MIFPPALPMTCSRPPTSPGSIINQIWLLGVAGSWRHASSSQEETFLGRDFGQGKGYSESTAAEIDSEMRDIIDEAYETCRRTLTEHIDQLHALAQSSDGAGRSSTSRSSTP